MLKLNHKIIGIGMILGTFVISDVIGAGKIYNYSLVINPISGVTSETYGGGYIECVPEAVTHAGLTFAVNFTNGKTNDNTNFDNIAELQSCPWVRVGVGIYKQNEVVQPVGCNDNINGNGEVGVTTTITLQDGQCSVSKG